MNRSPRPLPLLACLFVAGLSLAMTSPAQAADVPMLLNYQGSLTAPDGTPKNGTFTMEFSVYDAASGGNQLPTSTPWSETQNVAVTEGVFNVLLGSVTALPADLFEGGPSDSAGPLRFLNVVVDSEALAPRKRIGSAAYALQGGAVAGGGTGMTVQIFRTSGSWVRPAGCTAIIVEAIGGGGAGAGGATPHGIRGGGGGGGYARCYVSAPSASEPVVIGAGGVGVVGDGGAGGTSSFGSSCVASGGQGASGFAAGRPGTGTTGDIKAAGFSGFAGENSVPYTVGSTLGLGGAGGAALGTGGTPNPILNSDGGPGEDGAGGSGSNSWGQNQRGGNGGTGLVVVTEYY